MNPIDKILRGRIMVCEIPSDSIDKRRWVELQLQNSSRVSYPLKTPPHSALAFSSFWPSVSINDAEFKLRISDFEAEDIERGMDPSYENVGEYINIKNYDDLVLWLDAHGVRLSDFVDSAGTDYPL